MTNQLLPVPREVLEHAVDVLDAAVIDGSLPEDIQSLQYALAHALQAILDAPSEPKKPYAWRNPMNGVVISNDRKECTTCVGNGYPNFSEPLYAKGKP